MSSTSPNITFSVKRILFAIKHLEIVIDLGSRGFVSTFSLRHLCAVAMKCGDHYRAARFTGAIAGLSKPDVLSVPEESWDDYPVDVLRERLNEEWEIGHSMTPNELLTFARSRNNEGNTKAP